MKKIMLAFLMSLSCTLVANLPPITSEAEATRLMEAINRGHLNTLNRITPNQRAQAEATYNEDVGLFCDRVVNLPGWGIRMCGERVRTNLNQMRNNPNQ